MIADEIKKLREIQHLVLIRDEDANLGAGKQGESLAVKMEALVQRLEAESLAVYKRLQQKGRIFLSPLAKGNCSACGLKVPTSVLQHVIAKDRFVSCGNCGRLLYVPVVASPFYLKLIAAICKTFEDEEKLPFVIAPGDAKTLWEELDKATRVAVKNM